MSAIWEAPDAELVSFVGEQEGRALENYRRDGNLLREHAGQEAEWQRGGYGTRQIPELLQNAVDAHTGSDVEGRVEFRMAGGSLYVANQGAPFHLKGLEAVCYAFISPKRGEEIGKFGIGFKSVLAVTSHPQIYSRTVSFEFNSDVAIEALRDIVPDGQALPAMRVPTLIDHESAFATDPHLAELASWATTIVRLPLERDGARIRDELLKFDGKLLLFTKGVIELTVSLAELDGSLRRASFRRRRDHRANLITIETDGGVSQRFHYREALHQVSKPTLASLSEAKRRDVMPVAYAVDASDPRPLGQFWSWLPLQDETTARGIFNAPWDVSDDRRTMRPVSESRLNAELLDAMVELFLEATEDLSTPDDPARHLDFFPARGREIRSSADAFLSARIPIAARARPVVPDATGTLRVVESLRPPTFSADLSPTDVAGWQQFAPRTDLPHHSTYKNERQVRIRTLFREDKDQPSRLEVSISSWLQELARLGNEEALLEAYSLYDRLQMRSQGDFEARSAAIVPLESGAWASPAQSDRVLLPTAGAASPAGFSIARIDAAWSHQYRVRLMEMGFKEASDDQLLLALAATLQPKASDADWGDFWDREAEASRHTAVAAVEKLRARRIEVRVLTRAGDWRNASETLIGERWRDLPASRLVDSSRHQRSEVLEAAGVITKPNLSYPIFRESVFAAYADAARQVAKGRAQDLGHQLRSLNLGELHGIGPLDILEEAEPAGRAVWASALLETSPPHELDVRAKLTSGKGAEFTWTSIELWAIKKLGYLDTSLGTTPVPAAVGPQLSAFREMIPVTAVDFSVDLDHARTLDQVPDSVLLEFLRRDRYVCSDPRALTRLLIEASTRASMPDPERIPTVRENIAQLAPIDAVLIAESDEDYEHLTGLRTPTLLGSDLDVDALVDFWGLTRSSEVVRRWVEIDEYDEPMPVSDLYPMLDRYDADLAQLDVQFASSIRKRTETPKGVESDELPHHRDGALVAIVRRFDDGTEAERLRAISIAAGAPIDLELAERVIDAATNAKRTRLIAEVAAIAEPDRKLLRLVGADTLRKLLPSGLLDALESRHGVQTDAEVAQLFHRIETFDSLYALRSELRELKLDPPDTWAGSKLAREFVQRLGFPEDYAGRRTERPAAYERVRGRIDLSPLHDFQHELFDKVRALALDGLGTTNRKRALLYLPTGAGKTRVAVQSIVSLIAENSIDASSGPIVWIAQSEELCEQAVEAFAEVWGAEVPGRELHLSRFWDGRDVTEADDDPQVIVATHDTLRSRFAAEDAIKVEWMRRPALIVIDEAHRSFNPTYTAILDWFGFKTGRETPAPLLGLTATPYKGRNETVNEGFRTRFDNRMLEPSILGANPDDVVASLRERQVLSEPDHELLTGASVTPSKSQLEEWERLRDVPKSMLQMLGRDHDRTNRLVDDILQRNENWPTLVFTPSKASAHTVAALLTLRGRPALAVDGDMRKQQRREVIDKFKSGQISVLVNCDLLTAGFDAPQVRALYIARPTYSPNRYHQMVGRALRGPANGGTDRCLIVNVADTFAEFGEELAFTAFHDLWERS